MLILVSLLFWVMPEKTQLYMIANIFTVIEFIMVIIATVFFFGMAWVALVPLALISGINNVIYKKYND